MKQTDRSNPQADIKGWQMAGATPRVAPVGTWGFAAEGSRVKSAYRAAHTVARPSSKATLPRILPAAIAAAMISSLIGGVAVARYTRDPAAIIQSSAYPMNVAVTVQSGDSLWSIAQRYGNDNQYILDRIDEIASANEIETGTSLHPGQKIWVPAHTAEERAHITARRIVR